MGKKGGKVVKLKGKKKRKRKGKEQTLEVHDGKLGGQGSLGGK